MRKRSFKWFSLITALAISFAALNLTFAPITLPNVYMDPEENVYNPYETFTVDINIADVTDLYAWSAWISWEEFLLECVAVEQGPFLYSPDGTTIANVTTSRYVNIACSMLGSWPGLSGSGTLVSVTFKVIDAGKTVLDINYEEELWDQVVLLDHNLDPINHTVEDGYFETPQAANLVKKSAWPEHHHFSVSKDEDFNGTHANQTLFGKVKNIGPVGHDLYVYVAFEIVRDDGIIATPTSDTITLTPGQQEDLTADFLLSDLDVGKHYVTASCWYSLNGMHWEPGTKVKTFSFAVVL